MTDFTMIGGLPCTVWGPYKKWTIYRAYNVLKDRPMMRYFAVGITDAGGLTTLEAGSLDRIKKRVSEQEAGA